MRLLTTKRSPAPTIRKQLFFVVLFAFGVLAGCDLTGGVDQTPPQYVVEGYLVAGGAWRSVRVSRTTAVQDTFSFRELAVRDGDVQIEKLNSENEVTETYAYRERDERISPGVYTPVRPHAPVEPLATYRLRVEVPPTAGGPHTITATTTVPDTFRVQSISADTVTYQGKEQIQLDITRSRYPGKQSKYVFSTRALGNLHKKRLTPLYQEFIGDDEDVDLNDIRKNTSPILNESNYRVNPDNTLTISVPWLVFAFYGSNRLSVRALGDNMYDYLRSYSVQQGSPTLAPGELPNVIDHVDGGTGLFGSYARARRRVFVRPQSQDSSSAGA